MSAMFRRPRPGGGRHPPPLAPTVSSFNPRAQWTKSGSSIFLYVNLPGFYRDQIEIKMDERTRTVQIQGQRPLSSQTKARFNETYRVPETCDMSKSETSFSHGLLTIEFQAVVEGEKPKKAVEDQGKTVVQRPNQGRRLGPGLSNLGRKKSSNEEKQVGTSQEKVAPKLDETKAEGKRALLPSGSREKSEEKVKEAVQSPILGLKERVKEEKVFERKESAQLGQQKKEEEASTRTVGGSLKPKVRAKEEKVTERKKDIGQDKTGAKVKEEEATRTPTIGSSLDPKAHAIGETVVERKEEGKIVLGQKEEEKPTKPIVGHEAKTRENKIAATNKEEAGLKRKEKVNRIAPDVNSNVRIKQDEKKEKMAGDKVQEKVQQKKIEEASLAKERGDANEDTEAAEPKKVYLDGLMKKESVRGGGEDREKMVEKSLESETGGSLVHKGQNKIEMDPSGAVGGRGVGEEESNKKYDISLVNVGVAALVIMGFGAYIFVPLLKLFF